MFLTLVPIPTLGKGRTAVFVHYKQLKKQSNKQDPGNKLAYIVLFDKVSMIQANILKSALSIINSSKDNFLAKSERVTPCCHFASSIG